MKRVATVIAASALLSGGLSGCFLWTTRGEGEAHERRLAELEAGLRADRQRLDEQLARAQQKVTELEQLIERATAVVTRNSADTGARVEELQTQVSALEGQIAELRQQSETSQRQVNERLAAQSAETKRTIESIARKAGVDLAMDDSQIPADRTEHYQSAYRAYQAGEHSKSRALFRAYVQRYAQDEQADNAQYWIGSSYLQENQPARALGELRRVINEWARGDAVDEALFDMADAFYRLHACTDARTTLDALIRTQATSPLVRRARDKLREIQRAPRGYCTS